jgi:hypothetical protein
MGYSNSGDIPIHAEILTVDFIANEFDGQVSRSSGKKIGVPRIHGSHAAWELLSPDLRCF